MGSAVSTGKWRTRVGSVAVAALSFAYAASHAASVPDGFVDSTFVSVPSDATAMQFAPDGRLFVCQQSGGLRVVQNGTLLSTSFLTLTVDASGERGVLGVAFDPDFATNHFVYVYYTATSPNIHNRVSRFTANGNVAVPGSEVVILELNALSDAPDHNGGAIHFGNDGKLYIAVGDNANGANSQALTNLLGKILRINRDGTIPANNPFYGVASGVNRAIWARGLRNPFTTAFQPSTGRLFINDVGESTWEEVNEGVAGANYGWPLAEGPSDDPDHTDPFHYYGRSDGCAITGGAFYNPPLVQFPGSYLGDYFFADYCSGWIRRLDVGSGTDSGFASGIASPVDLKVGPDGALYYLARGGSRVGRISYAAAQAPSITLQPASATVAVGQSATFTVSAIGTAPLTYRWRRNGTNITGATASSYTLGSAQLSDSGAFFDVVVSNDFGSATSETAQLTVTQNSVPTAAITQPVNGTTYAGGNVVNYAGTGNDVEDGALPAAAFTWWVDLHHDAHTHPHVLPVSGSKTGSFTIPTSGETSANVFYRIHLRVTDSGGLTRSVTRDIQPRKATITLATNPAGRQLRLDGQPVTTPHTFVGVVGIQRSLEAVSPQTASGSTWIFSSWSDGGARVHTISTPAVNTTYTAQFAAQPAVTMAIANSSVFEGNSATTNAVFTVTLSAASAAPVSASWTTANGSAKAGTDYTGATGSVSFPAGVTSRTVTVAVHGDASIEGNEIFYVDLSAPSGATLADARAVGTIRNDDGPGTLSFSAASYQKPENGGSATVIVSRSGGLAGGMSVWYLTSNGTASAGSDYAATSGTLSFGAGVTSLSFQVPVTNDTQDEANETVNLTLSNPGGGAVLGTRRTAVLTIVDNDTGGTLSFSASTYQRNEDGSSISIKVLRTGGAASGVAVGYATAPGTANPTTDYTHASGTLNFAAGQSSASFTVLLKNDAVVEADETVSLSLGNPTGGAKLGARPTAVLTILDDD
jgi:glucose/arabinose dehydrogenase